MRLFKLKSATAVASLLLVAFITTGCHVQPQHPNQQNTFDGAAFDTLTLAHGALLSLRASISADFPSYTPEFNTAVETYNAALAIYSAYRNRTEAETSVSAALGQLTVDFVSLEGQLIAELPVNQQHAAAIRKTAQKIRDHAGANVTVADILTELEIAAALASGVPGGTAYAELAKAVITVTGTALAEEQAGADQPINLDSIAAIQPLL
jgi:hypothetical protein